MAGICSRHFGDDPMEGCAACHSTIKDLLPNDWERMETEAKEAGRAVCYCGFEFYLTTPQCPLCGSTKYARKVEA
jgi:hypothetical protein